MSELTANGVPMEWSWLVELTHACALLVDTSPIEGSNEAEREVGEYRSDAGDTSGRVTWIIQHPVYACSMVRVRSIELRARSAWKGLIWHLGFKYSPYDVYSVIRKKALFPLELVCPATDVGPRYLANWLKCLFPTGQLRSQKEKVQVYA